MLELETIEGKRVNIIPTSNEDSYLRDMKMSHRTLEPSIYTAALDFRFHPGKVLMDICLKENEERMGGFSIHGFSDDYKSCEIGYWILPAFVGQGFVLEAGTYLIEYLFNTLKMNRIQLIADMRNQRSIAVAERLGFKVEGVLQGKDPATDELITKLVYARYDAKGLELWT